MCSTLVAAGRETGLKCIEVILFENGANQTKPNQKPLLSSMKVVDLFYFLKTPKLLTLLESIFLIILSWYGDV